MEKDQHSDVNIKRFATTVTLAYVLLVVLFYFLAGDQLHYRQSRGNFSQPPVESGTVELVQGAVVEQTFSVKIQRLQSISVQWGTYYRANIGTVTMELYDLRDNSLVMAQNFNAADIPEGGTTTLVAESAVEMLYEAPLLLRIYSDSPPGAAASPLMSFQTDEIDEADEMAEYFSLSLNGVPVEGVLCFSAFGEDYIWTGLHYWEFAAGFGAVLALTVFSVWLRYKRGKHSHVVNALAAVRKYRFLIRQLVSRDFKIKYKRSFLGVFWSFLHPLLVMSVQYVVFSTIFKNDVANFAVYLLIGVVSFNFFSESCGMALTAILGNYGLITKVYVPKYIYPLTRVMSSVVNLSISLIPLILMSLLTGVRFQKSAPLSLYFFGCLIIFSLGLGLLLSASMVFFRDTQFLWGVASMIWTYATPIFYPETILPDNFRFILIINPLYYFIKNIRICILDGISPEPFVYIQCMLIAAGMLLAGALVFKKTQDKFVLYL